MNLLTILSLLFPEHKIPINLFSFLYLIKVLWLLTCKTCIYFAKFIAKHGGFNAITNDFDF